MVCINVQPTCLGASIFCGPENWPKPLDAAYRTCRHVASTVNERIDISSATTHVFSNFMVLSFRPMESLGPGGWGGSAVQQQAAYASWSPQQV